MGQTSEKSITPHKVYNLSGLFVKGNSLQADGLHS